MFFFHLLKKDFFPLAETRDKLLDDEMKKEKQQ